MSRSPLLQHVAVRRLMWVIALVLLVCLAIFAAVRIAQP